MPVEAPSQSSIMHYRKQLFEIYPYTSPTLEYRCIQDIETAKIYWNMFSKNESLFDNWDFRYCAYKYINFKIFFYVGFLNEDPIGLLPLEWNEQKGYLEFFGGFYMEDNKVFIKEGFEYLIENFYKQIQLPSKLSFISENSKFESLLSFQDFSYFIDTQKIKTFQDYIDSKFSKKTGKKFIQEIERIITNHQINFIYNRFEDIETMFEYSLKTFGNQCDLITEPSEAPFERELLKKFDCYIISIEINGKVEAVSQLLLYNNVMYGINGGINHHDIPNLGKLLFQKKVELALEKNCQSYHVGTGAYNWKRDWRLDTTIQNSYSNYE